MAEIFVTDANGCVGMASFNVEQPVNSVVSVISTNSNCNGSNGTAMAVISNGVGPFNYIWPNQTGPQNSTGGLAPGVYDLLVIDANTCLHQKEFIINEKTAPIIITDSLVTGTCSGTLSSIYINTIGGQGPFTFNWSDGSTNEDLTNVLPGEYEVQVAGNNNCSAWMTYSVEMSVPDENPICVVTVDSTTNTNRVVWTPLAAADIDYYNVYKESSQSGLYYLVGTRNADSLSYFVDEFSDPSIRSWRYKIAAVDNCGNEGELSDEHKTIHLTANLGVGDVVNLLWDNYEGFSYGTYYINRYHPTTGWQQIDSVASNLNSYTDQTPPSDSNLVYTVEIKSPSVCSETKAQDHNSTRSNRGAINAPDEEQDTTGGTGVYDYLANTITVMPNPNNGIFNIVVEQSNWSYQLLDVSGKLISSKQNVGTNRLEMNTTSLENGIYILNIMIEGQSVHKKIIKQ